MAIKLISKNLVPYLDEEKLEFIVDTDADLENLPECSGTGSTAVSLESGTVKVVNTKGEWVTFGEPAGVVGTWELKDELNLDGLTLDEEYTIGFMCDTESGEEQITNIKSTTSGEVQVLAYGSPKSYMGGAIGYDNAWLSATLYGMPQGWTKEGYKTITITEEPDDQDLIAWLKANATKVG